MPYGIAFITAAAALYTISIWSEQIIKKLLVWMVILLISGFICDLIGTNAMRLAAKVHQWNFHTIAGYSALAIMCLHMVWALLAIFHYKRAQELFSRYSLYAWCLWLLAFVSGIPKIN